MKSKKLSMILAASMTFTAAFAATPAISSFATTIHHKEQSKKKGTQSSKKDLQGVSLEKVNILTGKVIKTTPKQKQQELAIVFHGSDHMTYYNNKNLSPDKVQTKFHSKTQEELYNYLLNPNNRWAAENQAIGLHSGDIYNDCVFFVSSALRNIGVPIPKDIGYTTYLMNELQSLGWEKETDLSTLEPGDICFAGTAHTYVFMGWANKSEGVAWVADNQFSWFGTNFHPRTQKSVPNINVSPTTCYYRLPSSYEVKGNPNQIKMPKNYDYTVGTVTVDGLNIRSNPSLNAQVIGTLSAGERVQILGQVGDWFKINNNGTPAYVFENYVSGSAPKITKPYSITYKTINTGVVDFKGGTYTDIQQGPSWDSNFAGELTNGSKISITGESGAWYRIDYNEGSAWILKDRVDAKKVSASIVTKKDLKAIGTGTIDFKGGSFTDIQTEGTWNSNFAGELTNGTKVTIVGQKGNWYEIENGENTAWVLKDRVNSPLNEKVIGHGVIDFTGGPFTDIQTEGTWNSNFAGELTNGTKVTIIGQNGNWYEIENGENTAWVLKDRVNSPLNEKVIGHGVIDFAGGTFTDIQDGPSWNSNFAGELDNNTKVTIIGESGAWYKINTGKEIAWVLKDRVNTKVSEVLGTGVVTFVGGTFTDIQAGPSWDSNFAGELTNGTKVTIVGEKGAWYQIENGDGVAWVLKNRINTPLNKGINPLMKKAYIDFNGGSFTDIVSGPSWDYNFVGELNNETEISIIGEHGNWYEISYDGKTAWVLKDRTSTTGPKKIYATVNYNTTMSNYVAEELQNYVNCVGGGLSQSQLDNVTNEISRAVNPKYAATDLEYLRVDTYRNVNFNKFQALLQGKGVFSGQAQGFINAAKEYNIDPVYLLSQSALETGWGTSNFAQGITITQIANENAPIYQDGNLVGYQMINLPEPVTVYDLFGIGAYDASASFPNKTTILGTTYAYNHGWTSVASALKGAAQFLSENYIHNPDIAQNTPFELRYIDAPADDIWHQYASNINYAELIASIMSQNKDLYSNTDEFTFNIPTFQQ